MRRFRQEAVHLTSTIACLVVLCSAGAASATTVTYRTPGLTRVTLPAGVTSVHIVAVGGRGGGVQGGYGAVASADLALAVPEGSANQLRITVGGNGSIGVGGVNGGGAAPRALSLAGGGGGWSEVSSCVGWTDGTCTVFERQVVAAGGGGAGAAGIPGTGGAGGSAGARGEDGWRHERLVRRSRRWWWRRWRWLPRIWRWRWRRRLVRRRHRNVGRWRRRWQQHRSSFRWPARGRHEWDSIRHAHI